jgi:hypothetical protein
MAFCPVPPVDVANVAVEVNWIRQQALECVVCPIVFTRGRCLLHSVGLSLTGDWLALLNLSEDAQRHPRHPMPVTGVVPAAPVP